MALLQFIYDTLCCSVSSQIHTVQTLITTYSTQIMLARTRVFLYNIPGPIESASQCFSLSFSLLFPSLLDRLPFLGSFSATAHSFASLILFTLLSRTCVQLHQRNSRKVHGQR